MDAVKGVICKTTVWDTNINAWLRVFYICVCGNGGDTLRIAIIQTRIQWVSINIDSDALKLSTCCLPRSMALAVRTDLIPPASYAILLQFWVKKHINTLSSYILVYNNNEHCEASMHWTVRYLWNHSTQGYIAKKKFVTINSIVMLAACHGVVPHNLAIFLPPRSYSAKQLDHRLSLNTDSPYMRPLWK